MDHERPITFFDSVGSGWVTCSPEHPEAEAFGPLGAARPIPLRYDEVETEETPEGWLIAVLPE